ncbi:hypothetical protein [Pseudomonas sp. p1(2021b)]|uniref:hypothetical protein n=1 Tax=Pseudomonas sp. p1(2021b) TaxID=2874628 RepID=UPI003D299984
MNIKRTALAIGAALAIGVVGFFGYGAATVSPKILKEPISYAQSFAIPGPREGQGEMSYLFMLGAAMTYSQERAKGLPEQEHERMALNLMLSPQEREWVRNNDVSERAIAIRIARFKASKG